MDPQDQQEWVSSDRGFAPITVRADLVIPFSQTAVGALPLVSLGRLRESSPRERGRPRHGASGGERSPAAARLRCLGIHEYEALLHQRFLIIQGHAVQVDERLRVDKDPHVAELEDAVPLARLRVEPDVVAQARTTATLHAEAKAALLGRNAFLR